MKNNRTSETHITFYCSNEQKEELKRRAAELGLSVPNLLRQLLGWGVERQGQRKDLADKDTANNQWT